MSRSKFAAAAAVAVIGLGASATAASAGTITPTDGTPAFTAATTATHSFTVKGGAGVVRSTSATFNGSTTSPASASATINPVFSGVTAQIAGSVIPAAVAPPAAGWKITSTNSTSPFTGTVNTQGNTVITVQGLTGNITVPAQTKPGLVGVNSGANAVLGAQVTALNWTASGQVATFLGAASGADGTYSSGGQNINVAGVNIVP